jgi:xanthine dehydrogenase YagR molybdenum-binding subunit
MTIEIIESTQTYPLIGAGIDRVDGPLKVTGAARYPADVDLPNLAHAVLVRSTISAGKIRRIDTASAEAAAGVLAVLTHVNAPRIALGPKSPLGQTPPPPLQDDRIVQYGQYVAIVVAETIEQAAAAARLVQVDYEATDPLLELSDARAIRLENPYGTDLQRGNVSAAFDAADVKFEAGYTTPANTNNPLGLFATVAEWKGDTLTVHDATQWPSNVRPTLATMFGIPESGVRVLAPYVGGGFGAGLRVWPHVVLTVLAARTIGRPVKTVLTRPQMFTGIGHRPNTAQHVKLGAARDGRLLAIDHAGAESVALEDDNFEATTWGTASAYACANVSARDQQVRLNITAPGSMRAPGTAQGNFALESAIDELAYAIGMDPLALRRANYAEIEPQSGLPWSSNALHACYDEGAERFGWSRRAPQPRAMRDGRWLVGYGMASATYPWYQAPCRARVTLSRDGTAYVRSAATDIGTGTYTVMKQLAAETLGLTLDRVTFDLGDSSMPDSPQAGGSGLTIALGSAVYAACRNLVEKCLDVVRRDTREPLHDSSLDDVTAADDGIHRNDDAQLRSSYVEIMARHGLEDVTADGESTPATQEDTGFAPAGAFAAKFVEVRVDADLGLIRVARVVSAIDGGRILNEKLATSQVIGGTVGGIGMALFEETASDPGIGRIANATLADYLVAVNADIPAMEVIFVGAPDRMSPIGVKGVGEIGLVGIAAAIANAVYHATGVRVRDLPITLDRLL